MSTFQISTANVYRREFELTFCLLYLPQCWIMSNLNFIFYSRLVCLYIIQTLAAAPFPAPALGLKPEEFAMKVSGAYLIVNGQLLLHIQQSLDEVWAYLAQLKIPNSPLGMSLTTICPFCHSRPTTAEDTGRCAFKSMRVEGTTCWMCMSSSRTANRHKWEINLSFMS